MNTIGLPNNKQQVLVNRILCAMVLVLALKCLGASAYRGAATPGGLFSIDFGPCYDAAGRLNAGKMLYVPEHGKIAFQYVSSPLIPLLIRPLAKFPLEKATRIWAGINVGLLTAAIFLYCWGTGMRVPEKVVPVMLVLFSGYRYWPTTIELGIGNSDVVLLFLVCGMFVCNRYGKWLLFAALAVLAALTKTWMIGALFYLAVRRKWAAAAAGLAFLAAGLAILFGLVGWKEVPAMLQLTRSYSSQPMIFSNSVAGMARMLFSNNPIMPPWLNSRACLWAVMVGGYGFLLGGLGYAWLRGPRMNDSQAEICLGLVVMALVLGSPVSHQYYFVLALPLLWSLLVGAPDGGQGWALPVGAFAIYLALSVPSPSLNPVPEVYKHGIKSVAVATSFLSGMALWGMGLFAVARGFRTQPEAEVYASGPGDERGSPPVGLERGVRMKTIVIVPTYNEAQNLPVLLPGLAKAVPGAHVLLVDDGSPDGTADRAQALFETDPRYSTYAVLRRTGPRGLGLAYRDGFAYALEAGFDRVVQMDADGSHNPENIPAMLEASAGADLVIGSRYCAGGVVRDWPPRRVLLSRFAGWYVRLVLGMPFGDPTAGFRCWTRYGLSAVRIETLRSEGYAFQVEMALRAVRANLRVVEIPITFSDRTKGKSKMSHGVLVESMVMPWVLRFQASREHRALAPGVVPGRGRGI